MAKSTNDILFKFLGDTKSLDRATRNASKGMGKAQTSSINLTKAMGALGVAFGAREILGFGKDAIDAASDYEEATNAIEVASGEAADEIIEFGKTADAAIGLSETAVLDAGVAFSGFADKVKGDNSVAETFAEYITRVSDFGSVMNLTTDDALAKFQSALAGESEPLRRFGIDISAAATAAFALDTGITEVGETLSDDEKVLARYGLLMEETAKFAGDFANTSESAANQQKILNAELENAKVEIGQQLLPVYGELLGITRDLIPALGLVADGLGDVARDVGPFVRGVGEAADAELSFTDRLDGAKDAIFSWGHAILRWSPTSFVYVRALEAIKNEAEGVKESQEKVEGATKDLAVVLYDEAEAARDLAFDTLSAARAQDDLLESTGFLTEAQKEQLGIFELLAAEAREALQKLRNEWNTATGRVRAYEQAVKDSIAQLEIMEGKIPTGGFRAPGGQIGLAGGGTLSTGQTAIVGEEGPEIVTAGTAMRVHPNGVNPFTGGGGGANITINVTSLDPDAAAVAVADALRSYTDRYGPI